MSRLTDWYTIQKALIKATDIFGGFFYRYRIFILVKSLFCLSNSSRLDKYYQYYAIYELVEILKYNFGMLSIPIADIDHYRESTMVCKYGNSDLCKITFSDAKALDFLIPLKDYYYQSKKKADLQ